MRALVWIVIVATVLVAGGLVVDGLARASAEDRIASEIQGSMPGVDEEPDVTVAGFPFLTQLAGGRLESIEARADEATVEGLRMEDVRLRLRGVSTSAPYSAETAEMTALVRPDAVMEVLPVDLELEARDDELLASTTVFGLPLEVVLEPHAAGRDVEVDVTGFILAGARVDASDLPGNFGDELTGLRFPIEALPEGMELTEVSVGPGGIEIRAEGQELTLPEQ